MTDFDISKQKIIPVNMEREMQKSFISYAMATIISRALPDVRDGLKPVHRRILYSMHELGETPDKPYRKSVRVVGDVLGKYHPHGDSSVYDAMVRMAQDFAMRYPLIDGHGNFGSVDGDGAAAMRYTEARMSRMALEMLRDIDKETVDFGPNFDDTALQPLVLPARYPNLLVNGSNGIAVGMATNIPPHNMGEVINGVIALIDNPDLTVEDLMTYIPGPDFPTGALIMGRSGVQQAYRTGRGKIVMRARTTVEDLPHNKHRVIVTEIPYQVNKSVMIKKIADMVQSKRVEGIEDIREESDRTGMRVVIDLKADVNPEVVMNLLYKHTPLQETFGVIMLALVDGTPRVLSLKQVLEYYIAHQVDVVTRRTKHDLERCRERDHIVSGLLKALDFIDAIIALIRASKTTEEAKNGLMSNWEFSDKQAQAILDMRLQRLTGLERTKLEEEHAELVRQIEYFVSILEVPGELQRIIKEELIAVRDQFGDERRTTIMADPADIDFDELIQREDMVVTVTRKGYIKRTSADSYRAQNRGGRGIQGQGTKDEDVTEHLVAASTHDWFMVFTDKGRVFKLRCYRIPEASRQARGVNLVNLIRTEPGENVQVILNIHEDPITEGGYLCLATRKGYFKRIPAEEFSNIRNNGLKAIVLEEGDALIGACFTDGNRQILLATRNGLGIRFNEEAARPLHRASRGVTGIKLREGDKLVGMAAVDETTPLLFVTENGYGKRTGVDLFRMQNRGGLGMRALRLTAKTGHLAAMLRADTDPELLLISESGVIIRTAVEGIPVLGRNTMGVRIMRLGEDDRVVSVDVTSAQDDPEEETVITSLPEEDVAEDTELEDNAEVAEDAEIADEAEPEDGEAVEEEPKNE